MADLNKAAIASAIRLVEARWVGSNFMSHAVELQGKRLFAVQAYRNKAIDTLTL